MSLSLSRFIIFSLGLVANCGVAHALNSGITYQGRILKPDGTPLSGHSAQFKMQIRTPNNNNCLMYEEIQTLDMSATNGTFSLTMNDLSGTRTDSTGLGFDRVFMNFGALAFNPATCGSGSTYTPSDGDGRNLIVYFKDETMGTWEPVPAAKVNYVPYAFSSQSVQGYGADSLLRVVNASGDPITGLSPFSNAQYTELLAIIGGTTTQYTKAGQLNGVSMPAMSSGQVLGWNGTTWTSTDPVSGVQAWAKTALPTCAAGDYLRNNGSNALVCTTPAAGGTGTVTQVNTGTGLTGGGFTTTGTISIAAGGVSATELAAGAVTNAKIAASAVDTTQINAGAVTAAKLAADAVDSSKILDGSITGADLNAAINITTSGTVATGMLTTRDFKLYPASGSFKISMEAPTLTADYQLTWPAGLGTAGQILTTDASGNLSWTTPAVNGITALTGDVTGTGPGSTVATVASVGGVTAANVASGANLANAATNLNTASTIVKRDASGNFTAGTITSTALTTGALTHTSSIFKDTGTNTVTVTAPTTVSTSYSIKLPTAVASVAGQVLSSDTSGNTSWFTLPTALPPNGSAGGDLSGTYPNPTVATVGTSTAANVHAAELLANAATSANTVSTIVKRDASGNFTANVATANGIALNNAGSVLNITNPSGGAWNMVLPATAGTSGQVMQTNGSGVMTWTTPLTSSTGFINGGNSFGANSSLGNNDNFDLAVKTNNLTRMTVTAAGNVGIGTTSPATKLEVAGTVKVGDGGETCGATYAGGVRYNGGNIQFCNGTAWSTLGVAGAGITALTGDVTATGTGSVAATVANVGGVTAANVATGANLANAATNANTVSTIVKRDASGNFAASAVTQTSSIYKDSGSNTVTVQAPTTVSTSYTLKLPTAVPGSTQLLQTDNTGQLSYVSMPTALPPNGAAGGDLSGTYPNPTVATVGGSTAANVNTTVTTVTAATAADTVSTIVKRDGSGNFLANNITADSTLVLKGTVSGSVTLQAPSSVTSYTAVWPSTAGSASQVLTTNGSGTLSWSTPAGGALTNFTESLNNTAPNATVTVASLAATNAATNVDIALSPKGSGSLLAQIPDSTATAGNKRGGFAVDWQLKRTNAPEVASGAYSAIGGGTGNKATGLYTTVPGGQTNYATGTAATVAGGTTNVASGSYSFVPGGNTNTASGQASMAAGWGASALGTASFAGGYFTTADSIMQTTLGTYNLPLGTESPTGWVPTDPLFVLGNGTGSGASRSNAMMVLKNGNVGIGTTSPTTKLMVNGTLLIGDGAETCSGGNFAGGVRYNGGNIQFCNGTAWSTLGVAGSSITALTGDVTASGSGSVAATVANVGGVTAANVASGANLANAATNANTVSTIVKRDGSGNFAAGAVTQTSSVLKDSGSNTITVTAPATVSASYSLKLPAAISGSTQLLQTDNTGQLSYVAMPMALPPNGSAGGDLSGTYPNPTVATVGGSTAANVNTTVTTVAAATAADTVSAIVKRDGTGNFIANAGAFDSNVKLNGSVSGAVMLQAPSSVTSYTAVWPSTAGTSGQVLSTNGSGTMNWVTAATASTAFMTGGNSFGSTASVGTNDSYRLDFKTNGSTRMSLDTSGNLGIGTTGPSDLLHLQSASTSFTGFRMTNTDTGGRTWGMNTTGSTSTIGPGNFGIYDWSGGGYRMVINASGFVGFGTGSPVDAVHIVKAASNTLQMPLRVQNLDATNTGGSATGVGFRVSSSANDDYMKSGIAFERTSTSGRGRMSFLMNNVNDTSNVALTDAKMTIDSSGNVGIGTTSPSQMLDVTGNINSSGSVTGTSHYAGYGSASAPAYSLATSGLFAPAANTIALATNNAERFRITSAGLVGIGTTSPGQKLSVAGTVESTSGGFKFPDGTTQASAASPSTYDTSCVFPGNAAICVQITVSTGATNAKRAANINSGGGWVSTTTNPFSATTASNYGLSCSYSPGATTTICIRTDKTSGATSCMLSSNAGDTWSACNAGAPF